MAGGAGLNDRESSGSGSASAPEDGDSGTIRDMNWDVGSDMGSDVVSDVARNGAAGPADIRLVLAEDGARVLHATPGAGALLRALAPAGTLPSALARQIRSGSGAGARMLRLRLDPRGIAPPTLCRTLPGRSPDGRALILLAVIGPLPALRTAPAPSDRPAEPLAEPPAAPEGPADPRDADRDPAPVARAAPDPDVPADPASAAPRPGDRVLWRSDAEGALTQLSGGGGALAGLVGASWDALAASGRLGEAGAFLDALARRRTFRGLGVVLVLDGVSVAADLSGAPLGRAGQAFQGYGGFGIVRAVEAREVGRPAETGVDAALTGTCALPEAGSSEAGGAAEAPDPADARPESALAGAPASPATAPPQAASLAPPYPLAPPFGRGLGADPVAMATMAAPLLAAWLQQDWFGPPARPAARAPAPGPEALPDAFPAAGVPPEPEGVPEQDAAPEPEFPSEHAPGPDLVPEADPAPEAEADSVPEPDLAPEPEAPASALTVSEHDAFREIARALGVRYAGDAADGAAEAASADPAGRGAVVPFSFAAARSEPEPSALLDGVPGPLLLHRGPEILAANRAFLDLAGYPDLAALRTAGLARLFPDPLPEPGRTPPPEGAVRILETRGGTRRTVALARGAMPWSGGPADSLLLRPLADDAEGAPGGAPGRAPEAAPVPASAIVSGTAVRPPAPVPDRDVEPDADALRAVLDAVAEGVVVADAAGRVLALNRAAADLLDRDPRAALGAALDDLVPPDLAGALAGALASALAEPDGRSVAIAERGLAVRAAVLCGGRRALLLRPAPEAPRSEGPGFVARFLTQLDREIRAPLTGILGFADVMLKEPYGPLGHARYRSYLNDVRSSGEQVLGLVADLVDLATVETGGLPLSRRPLPLNDLVAACVAEMQAEAARGRIVLRTSFAEDLAPLEADEPSLARAARLVIGNAIRLTGAGGQVIVSTNPAERGAVALRVRDTGTGMSPEEIAFALEPFRGGRPESGGPDGAPAAAGGAGGGLGLPLSKALVEANDGRLSISSRKDEGTLVEILLPGRAARRA